MSRRDPEAPRRLAIIASKGTLDFAYPPFILGSTAAAMGWEVAIFFTFYGLPLLLRNYDPKVSPLGNPAMPLKMPFGPPALRQISWPIAVLVEALPGFSHLATTLMQQTFKEKRGSLLARAAATVHRCGRQSHRMPDDDGRLQLQEGGLHPRVHGRWCRDLLRVRS